MIDVDILDVSDLRFQGGTSGSIAEEVKAQAGAGYSTGVLHINGPLVARASPFHPGIRRCVDRGLATLVLPHQPIRAKIVVVRHPAVIHHSETSLPPIEADHVVVVANAAPNDIDGHEVYEPGLVQRIAGRLFGRDPVWAPIGPLVRAALARSLRGQKELEDDWVNIIDADAWRLRRSGWVADRPVIGRHSRPSVQKWPRDRDTLRAVYPTDGSVHVRVLGGAEPAIAQLGSLPSSWEVLPFGAVNPRDFLAGLDFFVYYHDPRWVEAFGRSILEALAAGIVPILPPHFEKLFADGAIYAEPAEVRNVIDRLYSDRTAYDEQAVRGEALARSRFGYDAHLARLATFIGESAGSKSRAAVPRAARRVPRTEPAKRRLLLISSNGSGMGHLTRLLALARRCRADSAPYFLSLSQAVPIVGTFGYQYEYVPSQRATGLHPGRWQTYFRRRVSEAIKRLRPAMVVFDGSWPYEAITEVRAEHPSVPWVWSRRGMWFKGRNREQLAKSEWFDGVIEPGDFAAVADRGLTAAASAERVGPITLLDRTELDDRRVARRTLGLDLEAPTALITLGAGNVNDTDSDVRKVIDALRVLDLQICVTKPPIAESTGRVLEAVHVTSTYPLARQFRAFDLAISAAGYNSFHELLRFGIPTLFVPNLDTAIDDQRARARYAADQGLAHSVERVTWQGIVPLLEDLLENGPKMVGALADIDPGNGAPHAIQWIEQLAER